MKLNRDALIIMKKALVYFVIIFIASVLQSSFLAVVSPFGAVPDLVLLLTLGAGYFCGPIAGLVFGIAAGAISYAVGGAGLALAPLFYGAIGGLAGFLVENFFKGKFAVWCIYLVFAATFKSSFSTAYILFFSNDVQLFTAIWRTAFPEFVGTVILGAALYVPIRKGCAYL